MAARRPSQAPDSEFPFAVSPPAAEKAKAVAPAKEPAAWFIVASSTLKRHDDVHATYAFLEWLEDNGYRAVTCSGGTVYVYDPADGCYRDRTNLEGFASSSKERRPTSACARFAGNIRCVIDIIHDFAEDSRLMLDA
jgi:hypothetical protein